MREVGALPSTQIVSGLGVAPAQLLAAVSCGAAMMGATRPLLEPAPESTSD